MITGDDRNAEPEVAKRQHDAVAAVAATAAAAPEYVASMFLRSFAMVGVVNQGRSRVRQLVLLDCFSVTGRHAAACVS